MSGFQGE